MNMFEFWAAMFGNCQNLMPCMSNRKMLLGLIELLWAHSLGIHVIFQAVGSLISFALVERVMQKIANVQVIEMVVGWGNILFKGDFCLSSILLSCQNNFGVRASRHLHNLTNNTQFICQYPTPNNPVSNARWSQNFISSTARVRGSCILRLQSAFSVTKCDLRQ